MAPKIRQDIYSKDIMVLGLRPSIDSFIGSLISINLDWVGFIESLVIIVR